MKSQKPPFWTSRLVFQKRPRRWRSGACFSLEEDKGLVKRRKEGRNYLYMPRPARSKTGAKMLNHVVKTFFDGSFSRALAAHLADKKMKLNRDEYEEMMSAIEKAQDEGR